MTVGEIREYGAAALAWLLRNWLPPLSFPGGGPGAARPDGAADPAGDGAASYDEWDERHHPARTAHAELRVLMRRRWGSHKLDHFIRWSIAVTAELPIEDRLPHLRRMLPDGLVGRHALSHLQYEGGLRPARAHDRRRLERRAGWMARERARRQPQRGAGLDVNHGLPARRLAHWLTALRLASATRADTRPRPSSSWPTS